MTDCWWQDDYAAITAEAGMVALEDWTKIEFRGGDRSRLLNALATNRLDDLLPGQGRETFLADARGRVVGHGLVFATPDAHIWLGSSARGGAIAAHIEHYILSADMQLTDRSATWSLRYLGGARAAFLLETLGIRLPPNRYDHTEAALDHLRFRVCRVEIGGRNGFLILSSADEAGAVADRLQSRGARPCAPEAFEAARIESGWPRDGVDIAENTLPQEVGRDTAAISFTKGCYLGQETVSRIESIGHVNRHLVGVCFGSREAPSSPDLSADGKTVGTVTSSTFSPALGRFLALAYVRRGYETPGTLLQCSTGSASVLALPVRS